MKSNKLQILILVLLAMVTLNISAITIKLGSPFPEGSAWHKSLLKVAGEWKRISGGQVVLRIYPGGVAGNEADMIRKMRFNQLDVAVLTTFGMKSIVPNSFVMTLPGILQSEKELDYVIKEYAPIFDEDFLKNGFRVLGWSKTGWAYFFTDKRIDNPEMLQKERLSVSDTDEDLAANFKMLGFNVVPVALNEVLVALQSGMASAAYCPPIAAAAYQWFSQTPYMLDFKLAPVIGGIVINEKTWQRIPQKYHTKFQNTINTVVIAFYKEAERLNHQAMKVMKANGLEIVPLSTSQQQEWFDLFTRGHALVIGPGKWIDEAVYNDFTDRLSQLRR